MRRSKQGEQASIAALTCSTGCRNAASGGEIVHQAERHRGYPTDGSQARRVFRLKRALGGVQHRLHRASNVVANDAALCLCTNAACFLCRRRPAAGGREGGRRGVWMGWRGASIHHGCVAGRATYRASARSRSISYDSVMRARRCALRSMASAARECPSDKRAAVTSDVSLHTNTHARVHTHMSV